MLVKSKFHASDVGYLRASYKEARSLNPDFWLFPHTLPPLIHTLKTKSLLMMKANLNKIQAKHQSDLDGFYLPEDTLLKLSQSLDIIQTELDNRERNKPNGKMLSSLQASKGKLK